MSEGTTYDIPETRLTWFQDQIAKLNKRALKLTNQRVYCTIIGYHFKSENDQIKRKFYQVFVAHPEVKLAGWEFIARVDHSQEMGNVVRVVPNKELPKKYWTSEPICEHCNIRRFRRDTFVMHCIDTSEYKQVGSSCLIDFTGHTDAVKLAKLAEILAIIGDCARGKGYHATQGLYDYRYVDTENYVALAADSVLRLGWTSRSVARQHERYSTADLALKDMNNNIQPSVGATQLATQALEWAITLNDKVDANDWEHNASVIAQSAMLEYRHLNIAASVVGVYWTKFVKTLDATDKVSNYVGNVGLKKILLVVLERVSPSTNSNRHVFKDVHGNELIWFATYENWEQGYKDKEILIKATVKLHQNYNGKKQTIINRVKIMS